MSDGVHPTGGQDGCPVLVYDGDCGFCRHWILRWRRSTGNAVEYLPVQEARARFPDLDEARLREAVALVEADGSVSHGADAVLRALILSGAAGAVLRAASRLDLFRKAAGILYRFVSRHRTGFSRLTRWLHGPDPSPSTYQVARRAILSGIGLVYLIAFASLGVQITGLAGSAGILPAAEYLDLLRQGLGPERYYQVPSLAWLAAGDDALRLYCWSGGLLGALLMAGVAPRLCAFLAWALYLSMTAVTRVFLNFQWDVLLLEAGFLAIFLAPSGWLPRRRTARDPSPAALFLFRWLLFRLMFGSGLVKLTSGDATWWGLTALDVHYETQPIPSWTSWYAHQLPHGFQAFSVAAMFVVELAAPFLIFGSRRMKLAAFWMLAGLQVLIAATGNYAFFNLLSLVLCLCLLDDLSWPTPIRSLMAGTPRAGAPSRAPRWRRAAATLTAAIVVAVSGCVAARRAYLIDSLPGPVAAVQDWIGPFRSLNSYGLFASMTTSRPEIVVEGSADGKEWKAYGFEWKPGPVDRAPGFVAPHQPRLDWQMWFAALGTCNRNPWFVEFMERLLQGSQPVAALLDDNPFPDRPPRYLRALFYDYRFTRAGGDGTAWWRRDLKGLYCPVVTLKDGAIRPA